MSYYSILQGFAVTIIPDLVKLGFQFPSVASKCTSTFIAKCDSRNGKKRSTCGTRPPSALSSFLPQSTVWLREVEGQRAAQSGAQLQVRGHPSRHQCLGRRVVAGSPRHTARGQRGDGRHPQQETVRRREERTLAARAEGGIQQLVKTEVGGINFQFAVLTSKSHQTSVLLHLSCIEMQPKVTTMMTMKVKLMKVDYLKQKTNIQQKRSS